MRESYTLDQVVADLLVEHGFRFRERDHVGLRADPPVVRLQPSLDGGWLVLDVDEVIGTSDDLPKARAQARELLGRRGSIWILGQDGLVQRVEEHIPQAVNAPIHVPVPDMPVAALAEPMAVSADGEHPASVPGEVGVPESTGATPAQLTAEAMRTMLGPAWVSSMEDARRHRDTEGLANGLKEGYHAIHALHPLLPAMAKVVQILLRAAGI